jgi:hypothetical protein
MDVHHVAPGLGVGTFVGFLTQFVLARQLLLVGLLAFLAEALLAGPASSPCLVLGVEHRCC